MNKRDRRKKAWNGYKTSLDASEHGKETMNNYELLEEQKRTLTQELGLVEEFRADLKAIEQAIKENKDEILVFQQKHQAKEQSIKRASQSADDARRRIAELQAKINAAEYNAKIDDAVEKMPQLEDVFVRFIERQELANDIFSDDIAAKADTDSILGKLIELGKTETYSQFPQMVLNYNETRKQFQNELRSVAKDVIDTGHRIYNPAQRLDAYCQDLLSHSDFREFIGLA